MVLKAGIAGRIVALAAHPIVLLTRHPVRGNRLRLCVI
jgi:hypothetical protein